MKVTAVVVTYNRKALLGNCLNALVQLTRPADQILVIDNASTDGTRDWLATWLPEHLPQAALIGLDTNSGGAGGFAHGLDTAIKQGADWVWMMDDDAVPHPDALAELLRIVDTPRNIYGSLATNGKETSWLMTLLDAHGRTTSAVDDVPDRARVQMLPFLGILIPNELVAQIGLPDPAFFIAADDVEYCVRAQKVAGAQIIVAGRSHIEHPKSRPYTIKLLGHTLTALALPAWKRYYDTRNRLLIARKYYGLRFYTQTIPGSFARLLAALAYEPRKPAQLWAWCSGMFDGLLGIKGKRHSKWGIKQ